MSINLSALMKQRYDTAANWTAQNPTLLAGEIGIESDTKKWKVGTGATAWTSLVYAIGGTYPIVNADVAAAAAIVDTKLATISTALKVSNSATTAASANTASAIVARDASGNFTAGTITAALTGAASSNVLKAGDTMTGVLAVTAGTAALPGVAFDSNTGIYSPGDDQVAISTNGTGRVFVTSGGLVGVGVTPTAKFESYFSSTNPSLSTNTGAGLSVNGTSTVRLNFGNYPGSPFSSWLQSSDGAGVAYPLVINPLGGNVGIGTTSPGYLLTVSGGATSLAANQYLRFGAGLFATGDGSVTNYLFTGSSGLAIRNAADTSEFARIDSSGRLLVGISTASGNNYLQIQGDSGGGTGTGGISLRRNVAPSGMGEGAFEGIIDFGPNDGGVGARIAAIADAQQGTDDYPSRLVFSTTADGAASPTERMRINNLGGTSWRSNGATQTHDLGNSATDVTGDIITFSSFRNTTNSTYNFLACVRQGFAAALYIRDSGNVVNVNNSYGAISDLKLKENIVDAGSQWSDIKAFRVRKYNLKEGQKHTQIGGIAQEVELVSPGLVTESPDRDEEGNDLGTVTKSINYSVLYMKAVKALQEAMERIETLETRLSALEGA